MSPQSRKDDGSAVHAFHLCFLKREDVDLFGVKIPSIKTAVIGLGGRFVFLLLLIWSLKQR